MKVSVPLEFDMDERFGVAVATTGELRLASRDECRDWALAQLDYPRTKLRGNVENMKRSFQPATTGVQEA